jgi:hypothetical protein
MDQQPQSCSSAEAWLMVERVMMYANMTGDPADRRAAERLVDAYFARCDLARMLLELKKSGSDISDQ